MAEMHRNASKCIEMHGWDNLKKSYSPSSPSLGPGGCSYFVDGRKSVESSKTKTWGGFSVALGPVEGTHFYLQEHDVAGE
jgi:hypothetical protein